MTIPGLLEASRTRFTTESSSGTPSLAARVTLAGGILAQPEERVLLREVCQSSGSDQSVINVVMAPAVVHGMVYPGRCTRAGIAGPGQYQGSLRTTRIATFARFAQNDQNRHSCHFCSF